MVLMVVRQGARSAGAGRRLLMLLLLLLLLRRRLLLLLLLLLSESFAAPSARVLSHRVVALPEAGRLAAQGVAGVAGSRQQPPPVQARRAGLRAAEGAAVLVVRVGVRVMVLVPVRVVNVGRRGWCLALGLWWRGRRRRRLVQLRMAPRVEGVLVAAKPRAHAHG